MASDDKAKKEEQGAEAAPAKKKSPVLLIAIVAVIMVLEGVGIFLFVAMTSKAPQQASAEALEEESPDQGMAELPLISDKFQNTTDGRPHRFELEVFLKVPAEQVDFVTARLEARKNEIRDRVGQVVRTTPVSQLNEPDLRSLRRQLRALCDELFEVEGEEKRRVQEIIVAKCIGSVMN